MINKWYPSHIEEAKRSLQDNLKLCDTIIEIVDARAPFATKNKSPINGKNKIFVINKIDLIPEKIVEQLEKHFKQQYKNVVSISATDNKNVKKLFQMLDLIYNSKVKRFARKGIRAFPIRAMVLGMPNVGKSRIINSLTGRHVVGVADKPGFTKGKKWVKVLPNVELLDLPGILWPEQQDLPKLVIIGSSKEDSNNVEQAASHLIDIITKKPLEKYYEIEFKDDILQDLGDHLKISRVDAAQKLLRDFRACKLGKISLESA